VGPLKRADEAASWSREVSSTLGIEMQKADFAKSTKTGPGCAYGQAIPQNDGPVCYHQAKKQAIRGGVQPTKF